MHLKPVTLWPTGDVEEAAQLLASKEVRVNCLDEVQIYQFISYQLQYFRSFVIHIYIYKELK